VPGNAVGRSSTAPILTGGVAQAVSHLPLARERAGQAALATRSWVRASLRTASAISSGGTGRPKR